MLLPSLVLPAAAILIAFGYSQLPWSMLLLARQPSQVYDSMSELAITKAADYISSHCYRQQQQHLIHSCSSSSNSDLCKFTFTSTLAHFHTFTHTHTQTHTHIHTHTRMHARTHARTHTRTPATTATTTGTACSENIREARQLYLDRSNLAIPSMRPILSAVSVRHVLCVYVSLYTRGYVCVCVCVFVCVRVCVCV